VSPPGVSHFFVDDLGFSAAGGIANGGFETGDLSGWQVSGDAFGGDAGHRLGRGDAHAGALSRRAPGRLAGGEGRVIADAQSASVTAGSAVTSRVREA
jgi:hypothetical protein